MGVVPLLSLIYKNVTTADIQTAMGYSTTDSKVPAVVVMTIIISSWFLLVSVSL